ESWGIGGGENDNGALVLIAVDDRKIRIHTGYGVEGAIPDAIAKRIIENEIKPEFARGDFYHGLDNAANAMIAALAGEYKATAKKKDKKGFPLGILPFIVFFVIWLLIRRKRHSTYYGTR